MSLLNLAIQNQYAAAYAPVQDSGLPLLNLCTTMKNTHVGGVGAVRASAKDSCLNMTDNFFTGPASFGLVVLI